MEIPYPLLALEVLFLVTAVSVWFARNRRENEGLTLTAGSASAPVRMQTPPRRKGGDFDERLRNVPIPWGWPNCNAYKGRRAKRSFSENMHEFAEILFAEKQLVSETRDPRKVTASIRALIEDRHHPVGRQEEPDGGEAPLDGKDIWFVGPVAETRAAANRKYHGNLTEVRELRAPWGW